MILKNRTLKTKIMEIVIKKVEQKEEKSKYPYLGVSKDGEIVWITERGRGISINDPKNEYLTSITGWNESAFTPVKKLTVEI